MQMVFVKFATLRCLNINVIQILYVHKYLSHNKCNIMLYQSKEFGTFYYQMVYIRWQYHNGKHKHMSILHP